MSKSPSLRRIQADIRELAVDPSPNFYASPLENDMFEWHFTIRGAKGTDFEGGVYHGRILLPPDYPFKPPHIIFLTPSGRFETNTKVCLSFSAYHPELWQPAWGIRLILEALISFLPTPADGAIGALDWSPKERKRLALQSQKWCCPKCGGGPIVKLLPNVDTTTSKQQPTMSKEIAELHRLQQQQQAEQTRQQQQEKEGGGSGKEGEAKHNDDKPPAAEEAATTKTTIDTSAPEEEIVFGDDNNEEEDENKWEDIDNDIADALDEKMDEDDDDKKKDDAPELVVEQPQEQAQPTTTSLLEDALERTDTLLQQVEENAQVEEVVVAAEQPQVNDDNNISKWADPLVNFLIVLLMAICYLLYQKYLQLELELRELEAYQYSEVMAASASDDVVVASVGMEGEL